MAGLHAGLIAAGTNAQESDPVAVLRVHVRLNLEHEAGERFLSGCDLAGGSGARPGRWSVFDETVQHFLYAEVGQRRTEIHRGQASRQVFLQVEGMAGTAHQFDFVA